MFRNYLPEKKSSITRSVIVETIVHIDGTSYPVDPRRPVWCLYWSVQPESKSRIEASGHVLTTCRRGRSLSLSASLCVRFLLMDLSTEPLDKLCRRIGCKINTGWVCVWCVLMKDSYVDFYRRSSRTNRNRCNQQEGTSAATGRSVHKTQFYWIVLLCHSARAQCFKKATHCEWNKAKWAITVH